jgi:antitoxin PrlF
MNISTLTSKGQTTIPYLIREAMNLQPGDRLEFIKTGDSITIIPLNKSAKDLKGILHKDNIKPLSCEEINQVIRSRHDSN